MTTKATIPAAAYAMMQRELQKAVEREAECLSMLAKSPAQRKLNEARARLAELSTMLDAVQPEAEPAEAAPETADA